VPKAGEQVWLLKQGRWIVGFALAVRSGPDVWTTNCVVAGPARGQGGQRALLDARIAWARITGAERVLTYTDDRNWLSARNLVASGFRITTLDEAGWVYFTLNLT
jgi:GNAT superfamily N-acetyltransferase